ncbi:hypothetical protein HPB51_024607 [Rhipicephalus microplus]|uniref:Uncharacterized protein n=1 Tax=Rhipicephalus microplus TaxID=6941 RepID=A0A9J6EDP2_RHIMP|nr:hypothetical protein HPB51_024607 [Rhipicephalus microplus]
MQYCFRKAGLVRSLTSAVSVEDVVSDVLEDAQQAWREAVEAQLMSDADDLGDLIAADDAVWVTEKLYDSAIISEVQAEAHPQAPSSDEGSDDHVSPPAPIGSATASDYVAALIVLVFSKGLPEEHAPKEQLSRKLVVCVQPSVTDQLLHATQKFRRLPVTELLLVEKLLEIPAKRHRFVSQHHCLEVAVRVGFMKHAHKVMEHCDHCH